MTDTSGWMDDLPVPVDIDDPVAAVGDEISPPTGTVVVEAPQPVPAAPPPPPPVVGAAPSGTAVDPGPTAPAPTDPQPPVSTGSEG